MAQMSLNSTGSLILTTEYRSSKAVHCDQFYCGGVNMWRDVFTHQQQGKIIGCETGETITLEHNFKIAAYDNSLKRHVYMSNWKPPHNQNDIQPRLGRWYPGGFVHSLPGIFPKSTLPIRMVGLDEQSIIVDCNHPLAGKELSLGITVNEVRLNEKERGGRCTDWIDEALKKGPGMELPLDEGQADFDEPDKMARLVEDEDGNFYGRPRLVNHIDDQAREHLLNLSEEFIAADMRVLDLMSSMQSHLSPGPHVTGLGMNIEEMQANPVLTEYLVHDLNMSPAFPFADHSFDAICCHLSIEYLLHPQQILRECSRVLTDNGVVMISFSNRWFPEKVTRIWQMLHEFERVGYVMKYMAEEFTDIRTFSYRNWPRPHDDPHYMQLQTSDPLYAVVARKR
jgi:hypothetical protein